MSQYAQALEYMVKIIAENPDEVEITEQTDGTVITLYIKAAKSDYGAIIGKGGQMVQNMRRILTVKAVKDGIKININIDDEEGRTQSEEKPSKKEVEEDSDEVNAEDIIEKD